MRAMTFETNAPTATQYVVGPGALGDDRLRVVLSGVPACVVVDDRVGEQHPGPVAEVVRRVDCLGVLPVTAGESFKSFGQLERVLTFLDDCGLPKHGIVAAVGGGTVGDVVGLAATLMRRGTRLVLLPTTLLAQVDAAVGGKNGVNFGRTKNLVGQFHHAELVVCDQRFLPTLPAREVVSGIAESIKVFAVADAGALARHAETWRDDPRIEDLGSWRDAVWTAVRWKLRLLAEDPYETSSRRLLNYGHAFAHFLEEHSGFRLLHGEAVLLGMMVENEISLELGIGRTDAIETLQAMIAGFLSAPCRQYWPAFSDVRRELHRLRQMRRGMLNLVCLVEPGDGRIVDDAPEELLATAWHTVDARLRRVSMPASTGAGPMAEATETTAVVPAS